MPPRHVKELIEQSHAALAVLGCMPIVHHYHVVGSTSGVIGLVIVCAVLTFLVYCYCNPCEYCKREKEGRQSRQLLYN